MTVLLQACIKSTSSRAAGVEVKACKLQYPKQLFRLAAVASRFVTLR